MGSQVPRNNDPRWGLAETGTLQAPITYPSAVHHFTLPDMSCGHCVAAITEALRSVDPQAQVDANLDTKTAAVDSALPREAFTTALTEAGYPPAVNAV